jgi:hypothetical protein
MPVQRCPKCSIIYMDEELEQGVCPSCHAPLGSPREQPGDAPLPAQSAATGSRSGAPFLLGLLVGCLIGPAVLWGALQLGAPLLNGEGEQQALAAVQAEKTEADNLAKRSEADRQAAESSRALAVKARDEAKVRAAAASKQKDDAEQRLQVALVRLAEERGRRASLEKVLAERKKTQSALVLSFVRDWQLLGPFASISGRGHDTVYPPEREPVQLKKAYQGFGGPVRWRLHHSAENKIDLAEFFNYRGAGAAYAVSWAFSDKNQPVTLGVGSDDGVRLWINRAKVHDIKGGRQARPGQDLVKVRLKKGWNEILAKVDNIMGTWEFYLEFRTADGRQPLQIFSTSAPPAAR